MRCDVAEWPKVLYFERDEATPGKRFGAPHFVSYSRQMHVPEEGEWYLSGAIPQAYRAGRGMTTRYYIVYRGARAKQVTTWVKDV